MQYLFKIMMVAICLICCAPHSHAQTRRLGLWEQWAVPHENAQGDMADINKKMMESNRQFKEKMAALDPDKKKTLEAEMASSGVNLHLEKADGVMALQFCVDQKWLDKQAASEAKSQAGCKRTVTAKPDDITELVLQCKQSGQKPATTVTMIFRGDTDISVETPFSTMRMRWVQDDCGTLKN